VSVRSSAVSEDSLRVSFAGMHDTFLNVKAELELVLENVKKCWASLFSERAVIYRMKKGVLRLEGMAVIVQEMIPAEVSGVTFTLHPLNKNALLIESARGLGDLIVSGKIIPDYFVINRKTLSILEKRINERIPSLSDSDVKKIAKICLKVEKIFINPQDIEWCIFDNRIWLLQSRAITTNSMIVKESLKKKIILKGIGASPGIAQGKVKIVLNPGEVHKVKEGDILVTVMTNPLYLTAIQKAKAIITDIGGMICHAAIVARELGIPCVVGTKNATKVLKDNMEVVVNGTEGKVYASS
ncbi:MAG: PEP/pyruvate-binding domain-containing protein, partial [Candidatus Woesearchaeota archaeon]